LASWRRALPVALLALPWLASCGGGTAAIATLFKHGGGSAADSTRVIADVAVDDPSKTSPASVSFRLIDPQGRPMSLDLLVVHPGGQTETALLTGDTNLTDLSTSGAGVVHVRQWDFAAQLPTGASLSTGLRILVREHGGADGVASNAFDAGNDAPLVSVVDVPSGEVVGPVAVGVDVSDSSSDLVDVLVEYSDRADPTTWKPATPFGTDLQRLATTPAGIAALFLWDVGSDEPHREFTARLRFTPTDRFDAGAAVETPDLLVDNNAAPTLIVDGSGFFADPDTRRGIPVRYQIVDEEGDAVRVVFQWARDSKSFPVLPGDPASIDAILASPDLRHQYQIATEQSIAHRGRVAPVSSVAARLPGLASASAGLLSEFLVGRGLELLPVPAPPGGRAAG